MSALVLDAGALIAAERLNRKTMAMLRTALDEGLTMRSHAMVVGQVWRDGSGRQAVLARLLGSVDVVAVDESIGRAAGELCGVTGTEDPTDAALVVVAEPGDLILTSDAAEIQLLASFARLPVRVVAV